MRRGVFCVYLLLLYCLYPALVARNANEARNSAVENADDDAPLKWGDSFDKLSDERRQELRERLLTWTPEQATMERPGPFFFEQLNGLEVFWLAACALAGADRDIDEAARRLVARDFSGAFPLQSSSYLHLECVILDGAYLQNATLFLAWLTGASMQNMQSSGANFSGAHMEGANLSNSHLSGAVFAGGQLNYGNLSNANLDKSDLTNAQLQDANFREAHMERANLSKACLERSDLRKACLDYSDLDGVNLEQANLSEASARHASLRMAQLQGSSFYQANLERVNFFGAHWKEQTLSRLT